MLLGLMPSEWDTWYRNADGTDRNGKLKDWPPKLRGPPAKPEQPLTTTIDIYHYFGTMSVKA
jgi:hypothetical protein